MSSDKSYSVEQRLNTLISLLGGNAQPAIPFASTGSQVNPTTDHSMGTFTVPAGDVPGSPACFDFVLFGHAGFGSLSPVLTIKLWSGTLSGTILYSTGGSMTCNSGGATARIWSMRGTLLVSPSGASAGLYCEAYVNEQIVGATAGGGTSGGPHPGIADNASIDTTAQWKITASCMFSSSSGADNCGVLDGAMWRRY